MGQLEIIMKRMKIDWIINGVCTYKPNDSLYGDMFQSNVVFPLSVLNLAIKHGIKYYLTIGTTLPESFNLYSFTKQKFSDFGRFLSEKDNITFIDLKLEMFYGGFNEPLDRFMNMCRNRLINNKPIELTSGIQKRDIIRVEDVVDIIIKLVDMSEFSGYKVLSAGTGEQHSIVEIVEYMKHVLQSNSELRYGVLPNREGEPNTIANIEWYSCINFNMKYTYFGGISDFCLNQL